jgi:hypothetical protein
MLPGLIPRSYVITSDGLALDPGDTIYMVHFDHDSQVTLGMRYEAKSVEVPGGAALDQFLGAPAQIHPVMALMDAAGREVPALGICDPEQRLVPRSLFTR